MKIGITYDLRSAYLKMGYSTEDTAEFDSEETIDAIADTIRSIGHEASTIGNFFELVGALSSGQCYDLVFNICEGLHGKSREAQVPAVLEAYNIPFTFSDASTLIACHDKAFAKLIVKDIVPTAGFFTVSEPENLALLHNEKAHAFPLFVKPLHEGTGKGVSSDCIVANSKDLLKKVKELIVGYRGPVIVERYLSGREFTCGVTGTGKDASVVGILEIVLKRGAEPHVYSYRNKEHCEKLVEYKLIEDTVIVDDITRKALAVYTTLGLRDAGRIDFKADDKGEIFFLEANPLPGLHPTHSDLPILCSKVSITYKELILRILKSAKTRVDSHITR